MNSKNLRTQKLMEKKRILSISLIFLACCLGIFGLSKEAKAQACNPANTSLVGIDSITCIVSAGNDEVTFVARIQNNNADTCEFQVDYEKSDGTWYSGYTFSPFNCQGTVAGSSVGTVSCTTNLYPGDITNFDTTTRVRLRACTNRVAGACTGGWQVVSTSANYCCGAATAACFGGCNALSDCNSQLAGTGSCPGGTCSADCNTCNPCVIVGPASYYAETPAPPDPNACSGVKNVYNRVGQNLSVSFTIGIRYQLTDPSLDILYETTTPGFEGFFTLAKEKLSSKYYFIIGDDDFVQADHCGPVGACAGGVVTGNCDATGAGDICRAFRNDFIPIVASQLIGGLAGLGSFSRITTDGNCININTSNTSYTIATATGPGGTIDFVFEDGTAFLVSKGWTFTDLGMGGGVANLSLDICVSILPPIPPPTPTPTPTPTPPPPPSPCPTGGLVPCGRSCDDPSTPDIDERKPCQLCHLFVMLDRIIDFLLVYILFPIAVLMLVFAGLLYIGPLFEVLPGESLNQVKGIIFSVVLGLIIIFVAFILIGLLLMLVGLADWTTNLYQNWWSHGLFQIKCEIK